MSYSHWAYRAAGNTLAAFLIPPVWLQYAIRGRGLGRFYQRLGFYPSSLRNALIDRPVVWLHAVSVGEVGVAASIIDALKTMVPRCSIALSTTTVQGWKTAKTSVAQCDACFYAPIDLTLSAKKALLTVKPDILCLLETEIWPNLIVAADQMGIPIALLNGRISARTIRGYRKVLPLMRHTLSHIDAFSMISTEDAQRIESLGAPRERLFIHGNAKFDTPDPYDRQEARVWAAKLLNLDGGTPVFVAGSTRSPEETWMLEAFATIRRKFPAALLVIAPRHVERVPQIVRWVEQAGLKCQLRTQLEQPNMARTAPVLILDTIGELSAVYSVADFVFCGGSLVDKGGQNVLEPALWGKPVMYGPSMEDFAEAHQLLKAAGASVTVRTAAEMAAVAVDWLSHPRKAEAVGRAARQAVLAHGGAAFEHARVAARLLFARPENVPRRTEG